MEWWMTLLVASVPVLITAVSLIASQWFNARAAQRSEQLRVTDSAAERAHQERLQQIEYTNARERADEDHRRHARESWKSDRRIAHTRLLTDLSEIQSAASSFLGSVNVAMALNKLPSDGRVTWGRVSPDLLADVELICSDSAAAAARRAETAVAGMLGPMLLLSIDQNNMSGTELRPRVEEAQRALTDVREKIASYRRQAKEDIDTVN